jgi:hypothetical protein
MKHPVKHLRFPKAAVELVAKFPHVTEQMFGTGAVVLTTKVGSSALEISIITLFSQVHEIPPVNADEISTFIRCSDFHDLQGSPAIRPSATCQSCQVLFL